jgi:hypothetical protein
MPHPSVVFALSNDRPSGNAASPQRRYQRRFNVGPTVGATCTEEDMDCSEVFGLCACGPQKRGQQSYNTAQQHDSHTEREPRWPQVLQRSYLFLLCQLHHTTQHSDTQFAMAPHSGLHNV